MGGDGPGARDVGRVDPTTLDPAARAELAARLSTTGTWVLVASWTATALFVATAVPAALGLDAIDLAAATAALVLFGLSLVAWVDGLVRAAVRTTHGDDISVAGLYFLQGSAPRRIRRHLFGSLIVAVVCALATAVAEPFGTLVPSLQVALVGEWASRYGVYPARREPVAPGHRPPGNAR